MNSLNCIATVGVEPELRSTRGGMEVLELRVAISARVKKGDEWTEVTTWANAAVFGRRATSLAKYIRKGDKVGLSGALHVEEYDKKDGSRGYSVRIVNADVTLCAGTHRGEGRGESRPTSRDFGGSGGGGYDDFPADDGDDIPFARCDIDTRRPHDPTRGVL